MHVFVVYCHPSKKSFTHTVKESFIKGLEDAGHTYEISDLYADKFNPVMSEEEYIREGFYRQEDPVAEDVMREQEKINHSDVIVFIYPDFWTASPAVLEGWFQRVWTYGFAYGNEPTMKTLDKAIFLVTMGGSLKDEVRRVQLEAMKTVMIGDRIRNRAKKCEVYAFDEMTRGYGNDENREKRIDEFSQKAYDLAKGELNQKPKYVYHGSQYRFDVVKPMQAHGICDAEAQLAIYAAATMEEVIPFALPFRWYPDSPEGRLAFDSDGIRSYLKYGSIDPEGKGYIYVLPSESFELVDNWEWISRTEVKPVEVIEIKVKDYLHTITFSEEAKKIQKELYGE